MAEREADVARAGDEAVVQAAEQGVGFFGAVLRLLFLLGLAYAAWLYFSDERRRRSLSAQGADVLAPLRDHVDRAVAEGKRAAAQRRRELEAAAGKALSDEPVAEREAPPGAGDARR